MVRLVRKGGSDVPRYEVHSLGRRGVRLKSHAFENRNQKVKGLLKPFGVAGRQEAVVGVETNKSLLDDSL